MTPRSRLRVLAFILVVPFAAIVLRLFQIQILDTDHYTKLSKDRRRRVHRVEPRRGRILDRHDEALARQEPSHDLFFTLGALHPRELYFAELQKKLGFCRRRDEHAGNEVCSCSTLEEKLARTHGSPRELEFRLHHRGNQRALQKFIHQFPLESYKLLSRKLRSGMSKRGYHFREEGRDDNKYYSLWIEPREVCAMELALLRIARLTETPFETLRREITDAVATVHAGRNTFERQHLRREKRVLIRDVSEEVVTEILYYPERYPGIGVQVRNRRHYPLSDAGLIVTGYLAHWRRNQLEDLKTSGLLLDAGGTSLDQFYRSFESLRDRARLASEEVGARGIEGSYDDALRGRYGIRVDVLDSRNRPRAEKDRPAIPALRGRDIRTSLDAELQKRIHQELDTQCRGLGNGIAASVVVMDLGDGSREDVPGAILALCAYPSFDPNRVRERSYSTFLETDPYLAKAKPRFKRPYQAFLDPGSIFKLVVAVAALEDGIEYVKDASSKSRDVRHHPLRSREEYPCRRVFDERMPHRYHCTSSIAHGVSDGTLDLTEAIKYSCNTYFYYLGRDRLRAPDLAQWARQLGLGRPVKIDLDIPVARQKLLSAGHLAPEAGRSRMLSYAIGQELVRASPLQVARMVSGIALDGVVPWPYLVEAREPERISTRNPGTFAAVRRGMERAFGEEGGTAYKPDYNLDSFSAAAKTGTAQIGSANKDEYHSWIAGYAPAKKPSIAFVVCIERSPFHGGAATAPVVEEILRYFGEREPKKFYREGRLPTGHEAESPIAPSSWRSR